jgi:hypothetical protein
MTLLDTAAAYLDDIGWEHQRREVDPVLDLPFTGRNGSWDCEVIARDDQHQVLVYSVFPVRVTAADHRAEVLDFLNRVNASTVFGNFELDPDSDLVRYRTSIDTAGEPLSLAQLHRVLQLNVSMMDAYRPGRMHVATGEMKAGDAMQLTGG